MMNPRPCHISAAFVFGTLLLAASAQAQTKLAAPESPYGGVTVEEIVARVNDQIITRSDYDRAMKEMDDDAKQHGATMQQISEGHKDLLRNLIDQQLWLSKGKELDVTGETELVKRLDEIRKQYNMESLEDLEKAAKEQGISFEDFKANIRNQIITQEVMRDEVGRRVQFTQGEVERYYEAHKQEFARPESVKLSEILVSTGSGDAGGQDDPAKLAAAKAKADDIEAKLHAGGDFAQLAKTFSDGTTAADGGDLGEYRRGALAKVLEDKTFALQSGQYTEPIRTRQGYVILKVIQHVPAGAPPFKDVQQQVEESFYEARMMPAMRSYLTEMREQAYIDIKPGYVDSGASPKEIKPVYSAYTPPTAKKKKKVERTRFRETAHSFRDKSGATNLDSAQAGSAPAAKPATSSKKKKHDTVDTASMKPGKKEKIRYGQAPTTTLPSAGNTQTEDAGAVQTASATPEPVNPLEADTRPTVKTRFSAHAKDPKTPKPKGPLLDPLAPAAADAAEVADRQTQAAPLGLAGDTATKKKPSKTTTSEKKRLSKKKESEKKEQPEMTPVPQVPGAPAPATAPQSTTTSAPAPAPQS
jgi:peptidyl-prolyl cis-trans isomerase SurA